MSSHKTDQTISGNIDTLAQACRLVFTQMQLQIKQDSGNKFVANEKIKMLGFANPAKITVLLSASGDNCIVKIECSNLGFGPVQGRHVRGVAETFLSNLRLNLGNRSQSSVAEGSDIASQIQKLAQLMQQGLLTEEEFTTAKAKLL